VPIFNRWVIDQNKDPNPNGLSVMGAIVPIEIHIPSQLAQVLTDAGQPLPNCAKGIALIDSGATSTCVHESILTGLNLHPVGVMACGTANGPALRSVYPVRLVLPTMSVTVDNTQSVGVDLTGQQALTVPPEPIIALIGRNLLQQWVFTYNGPGGFWTVST
jgi:hypothetical protein